VLYALKALLDPAVPNNQGLINIVDIIAPVGTIINARFPAAVAARANSAQRIVDVVIGALAPAMPDAAVAAANGANTTAVFYGHDARRHRDYVYLETLGGGFGGRCTKDGKDGVQVHITNTSNLPIEAIEMEYPLMIESYGFVPDSGGPGKHRGGLGLRRVVRPVGHTMTFSGQGERFANQPWGIFGGGAGGIGRFLKIGPHGHQPLATKPMSIEITAEEAIVIETPGAGGYGECKYRSKNDLRRDFLSGKFSRDFLMRHYGYDPLGHGDASA
jgi:N-methylhydantoinase B